MVSDRKRNIAWLVMLLVASLSTFCNAGSVSAQEDVPRIAVDTLERNFGRVQRGTVVTETFTLRNAGSVPLKIENMQFSTPGMRAKVSATIGPGESAPLAIIWDTSQYSREAVGQAALLLNDPETPTLVFTLKGFVVSPIEIDPAPAFYLSQFEGESAQQTITIRVNQERDVDIARIERQGEAFDIEVEPVDEGREYTLTARGSTDLPPGRYRQSAILHTNDPDRPRIRLEVNILVKEPVHASVEAIDFGRIRIAALEANPSLLELVGQTVILESREPDMRVTTLSTDLDFVTLTREPQLPAQRVRIDVGVDPAKLVPGRHEGTVRIRTDVEGTAELVLPIKATIDR